MLPNSARFIGIFLVFTLIFIFALFQLRENVSGSIADFVDGNLTGTNLADAHFADERILLTRPNLNEKRFEERKNNLKEFCKCEPHRTMPTQLSYRLNEISRFGITKSNISFYVCLAPKAGSTSLTSILLEATGFFDDGTKQPENKTHRQDGKFRCHSSNCLQPYQSMPNSLKNENSSLTSIVFARDPMSRLVSAWKDKIDRIYGHQYYYNKFTKNILKVFHPDLPILQTQKEAADLGLKVSFKEFVTWISRGNYKADSHWTPITQACNVCGMHYNFIGHQEDFQEDVTSLLKILTNQSDYQDEHFGPRNSYSKDSTEDWYEDIPCDIMKIIFHLYKADYTAFSYPVPDWLLEKIKC